MFDGQDIMNTRIRELFAIRDVLMDAYLERDPNFVVNKHSRPHLPFLDKDSIFGVDTQSPIYQLEQEYLEKSAKLNNFVVINSFCDSVHPCVFHAKAGYGLLITRSPCQEISGGGEWSELCPKCSQFLEPEYTDIGVGYLKHPEECPCGYSSLDSLEEMGLLKVSFEDFVRS